MALRSPIPWLAAALVMADCVLWPLARNDSFPTPELISCYALAFCQVSLVAIWTALGTAHGGVRLFLLAATLLVVTILLDILRANGWLWTMLLGVQVMTIAGPLLVARGASVRLERFAAGASGGSARPLQFTMRHMLYGVTAAAILLGIGRLIDLTAVSRVRFGEAAIIGSGFALPALAAVWTSLGVGRPWIKLIVLLVVAIGAGVGVSKVEPGGSAVAVTAMVLAEALFLAVLLWVCRLGGYRLVRRAAAKNLSRPVLDSPTPEIVS